MLQVDRYEHSNTMERHFSDRLEQQDMAPRQSQSQGADLVDIDHLSPDSEVSRSWCRFSRDLSPAM